MVTAFYPSSLEEALRNRRDNPAARVFAGGTDLMVAKPAMESALFLCGAQELTDVWITDGTSGGVLEIGSCATFANLQIDARVPSMVRECAFLVAAPGIRNAGTIGGNICNASPAGDTLPVLYALSARVRLASLSSVGAIVRRDIPIEDFILGVRKTALRSDEILERVLIDLSNVGPTVKTYYRKIGARNAQAISKVSFAATFGVDAGVVTQFSAAWGSVGATAIRARDIENQWIGKSVSDFVDNAKTIRESYSERITPIDDQRSTAKYRKIVCLNLLESFVAQAVNQ